MTATEQQIRMAAKLYEARDTARRVLGDRYAPLMAELGQSMQAVADTSDQTVLSVAIQAARNASGFDSIVLLAAGVEHTEPSSAAMKDKP